jgi:Domain of Unknown Function with PDB structure (DUF3857)
MKKYFSICFLLLIFLNFYSQESANVQFGKAKLEELQIKFDANDSSAEAIMLYDRCDVVIDAQYYEIVKISHQRIKILSTSALDRGNIELTMERIGNKSTKINEIEAYVYNLEDGKIKTSVLNSSAIFGEKLSDWRSTKKIILPNVKVGSVIEYRYKLSIPFLVSTLSNRWNFQGNIPFRWSEINITVPNDILINFQHNGYLNYHIESKKDVLSGIETKIGTHYRYVIKDAPAFRTESYITSRKDYMANLDYGVLSNAKAGKDTTFVDDWMGILNFFYRENRLTEQSENTKYLNPIVKDLILIKDSSERLKAAFSYMTKNFIWNNVLSIFTKAS